jgi:RimJ/RimL family protein N-acetyltransferase
MRRPFASNSGIVAVTPRLIVRQWTLDDVGTTDHIYGDKETMRLFGDGSVFTPAELRGSFERLIADYGTHGYGNYAVVERESGVILGHCGAHFVPSRDRVECDWVIDRNYQGRGYATEAARAVFAYTFGTFDVAHIHGVAHRDNVASIAVMRKLGMTFGENLTAHGMPSVRYVLAAADFDA